jgi:hypothetical protein
MPNALDADSRLFACRAGTKHAFLIMSREPVTVLGVQGHRFWLLNEDGSVVEMLEPSFACDCEYSFHTVYELRDGTLFKFFGKDNDMSTEQLRKWSAEVVCHVSHELNCDNPGWEQLRTVFSARD